MNGSEWEGGEVKENTPPFFFLSQYLVIYKLYGKNATTIKKRQILYKKGSIHFSLESIVYKAIAIKNDEICQKLYQCQRAGQRHLHCTLLT